MHSADYGLEATGDGPAPGSGSSAVRMVDTSPHIAAVALLVSHFRCAWCWRGVGMRCGLRCAVQACGRAREAIACACMHVCALVLLQFCECMPCICGCTARVALLWETREEGAQGLGAFAGCSPSRLGKGVGAPGRTKVHKAPLKGSVGSQSPQTLGPCLAVLPACFNPTSS